MTIAEPTPQSFRLGGPGRDLLRQALDPAYWAKEVVGFEADAWQLDALRTEEKEVMFLCCRQSGKSTIAALKAVHYALFHPRSLIVLISPSQRQSTELFRKVRGNITKMENPPRLIEDNMTSLKMANGSRIVALPSSEQTIVGFSAANMLIEDEAARVPDEIQTATLPFLATTNGQYIQLSTPKKKRGHFFKDWSEGVAKKFKTIVTQVPRITKEYLDRVKKKLGSRMYSQEFLCEFLEESEGDLVRREWMEGHLVEDWPRDARTVLRFWDRAATEVKKKAENGEEVNDPDYTAGVLMAEKDGQVWICHCDRFQGSPKVNQDRIRNRANEDTTRVVIRMEQEPGSSGKDTIWTYQTQVLPGFAFLGVRSTGSKVERAGPIAAAWEAGNVFIVKSLEWDWRGFIDRICAFPSIDVHDDEMDAASGAFNEIMKCRRSPPPAKAKAVVKANIPTSGGRRTWKR